MITESQDINVSTEGVTLLYTVSVNMTDTIYELKTNFTGGILPLTTSGSNEASSSLWKTTRVIFLIPTNNMIIGFLGFHVDLDSSSTAFHGQNSGLNSVEPSTRPGLIEVITDSIRDDFSISKGGTGSIAEVAVAQALLHWSWRLGETFAAERRIMRVDGEGFT